MANQKQRKRRDKEKRHGIEIVEIDEDGNERVLDSTVLKAAEPPARVKGGGGRKDAPGRPAPRTRTRVPQPASWQRSVKRAALFAPIFFVLILVLNTKNRNVPGAAFQAVVMFVLFVPLTYYLDRFAFRRYERANGRDRSARPGR